MNFLELAKCSQLFELSDNSSYTTSSYWSFDVLMCFSVYLSRHFRTERAHHLGREVQVRRVDVSAALQCDAVQRHVCVHV